VCAGEKGRPVARQGRKALPRTRRHKSIGGAEQHLHTGCSVALEELGILLQHGARTRVVDAGPRQVVVALVVEVQVRGNDRVVVVRVGQSVVIEAALGVLQQVVRVGDVIGFDGGHRLHLLLRSQPRLSIVVIRRDSHSAKG
jgi:hypothetical protein